jgi:hypothetical protein
MWGSTGHRNKPLGNLSMLCVFSVVSVVLCFLEDEEEDDEIVAFEELDVDWVYVRWLTRQARLISL